MKQRNQERKQSIYLRMLFQVDSLIWNKFKNYKIGYKLI